MKNRLKFITLGLLCGASLINTGCSDYLDVSDEVAQQLTKEEVFNSPGYTKRWHGGLFNCISEYSSISAPMSYAFSGVWSHICGETLITAGANSQRMIAGFTADGTSSFGQRWGGLYTQIRDAMIFLENAHAIGVNTDKEFISEVDINRMRAEAKFLIAYSYFSLFELYGPVPFLDKSVASDDPQLDFSRTPMDEFLAKVDNLLVEVINSGALPETLITKPNASGSERYKLSEIVRPTKTTALALRAKLWVYAASPLFNGGYAKAMQLTNADGIHIFSDNNSSKWATAKERLEDLFRDTDKKGHKLYEAKIDGSLDPDRSIYELFQNYNDEILWATGVNGYNPGDEMENNTRPRSMSSGWGHTCVTQNSVDAFFDENGLDIHDPGTVYKEEGFSQVINPCNEKKMVDTDIYGMYAKREPRFYAGVIYEGRSWYVQYWNGYTVSFAKGGSDDNTTGDSPRTGYLLGKFKNREITVDGQHVWDWARPSILFRLADFYLYYAEVLNEINPLDPKIIEYVDKIRYRAGIPGYQELKTQGKKNIIGDQILQRAAIHRERQVELFGEGTRYFDIRRWMVAGKGQEGDQTLVTGMNMNGPRRNGDQPGTFFERTVIENRAWKEEMYLFPIPDSEIQRSKGRLLVQNPGW